MRKSLVVLLFASVLAIGLLAAALTGNLSEKFISFTLALIGLALILTRHDLVSWAHSIAEQSTIHAHWRHLRPWFILLFGCSLVLFAAMNFVEASQRPQL